MYTMSQNPAKKEFLGNLQGIFTVNGQDKFETGRLTPQRGVTSTAHHSENVTCRGVTSAARHAARSHSFVYISTT